jgi:tRNA threonylcarbamoyladenosine biosynthesis protein TsaE
MIFINDFTPLASQLALNAKIGTIIALYGNLGSGKTTFARQIINTMQNSTLAVVSPTFPIVQLYFHDQFPIWHFDLYRLNNNSEIWSLGLDDAIIQGIAIIEWAEKMPKLPTYVQQINIKLHIDEIGNHVAQMSV